jgi:hypothetical protein
MRVFALNPNAWIQTPNGSISLADCYMIERSEDKICFHLKFSPGFICISKTEYNGKRWDKMVNCLMESGLIHQEHGEDILGVN